MNTTRIITATALCALIAGCTSGSSQNSEKIDSVPTRIELDKFQAYDYLGYFDGRRLIVSNVMVVRFDEEYRREIKGYTHFVIRQGQSSKEFRAEVPFELYEDFMDAIKNSKKITIEGTGVDREVALNSPTGTIKVTKIVVTP